MPTYDFECPNGHRFEKFFRRIPDSPLELPCTQCGAPATRRISGGAGLLFKGSGFYITDYGKGGKKPEGAASESGGGGGTSSESTSGSSETKSDSKPAAPEKKRDTKSSSNE